jgi:hypothetical protein
VYRIVAFEHAHQTRLFGGPTSGISVSADPEGGRMAGRVFEAVFERVAGLDVHKAQVTACVRVGDAEGKRVAHLAEFATTVTGLLALADWLKSYGVRHVAMETTGVYWLPVWHILEDDFELTLCNARHVKNVESVAVSSLGQAAR